MTPVETYVRYEQQCQEAAEAQMARRGSTAGLMNPGLNSATPADWDAVRNTRGGGGPNDPLVQRKKTITSDGGSSAYYTLPSWASELRHLMEHKHMSPDQANIFKAAYRLGEKSGSSVKYDLTKIIFFANCMLETLDRETREANADNQ